MRSVGPRQCESGLMATANSSTTAMVTKLVNVEASYLHAETASHTPLSSMTIVDMGSIAGAKEPDVADH